MYIFSPSQANMCLGLLVVLLRKVVNDIKFFVINLATNAIQRVCVQVTFL